MIPLQLKSSPTQRLFLMSIRRHQTSPRPRISRTRSTHAPSLFKCHSWLHSYSLLQQISDLFQHGVLRLSVEFSCPSPSFYLPLTILIVDSIMAIIFYWHIPRPFLPRMPVSIASQIAFFARSHMMDDVQNASGDLQDLDRKGYRYGYGRYVGKRWKGAFGHRA